MLKYFVFNLCLVLLACQAFCEEPGDIDLEDLEDYADIFDGQDLNDTENYIVPEPIRVQAANNNKSYTLNFIHVNWHTARELCTAQNQVLASIKDFREYMGILSTLSRYGSTFREDISYWVGGSQLGHYGRWCWVSTGQPFTFYNWRYYNAYDYNGCLEVLSDGQWNSNYCEVEQPFICEDLPKCN